MSRGTGEPVALPASESRPPELIPLPGGVSLRRRTPADAPGLNTAVRANLGHLRPWMPWARAAPTLAETEDLTRAGAAAWEAGTDFMYVVGLDTEPGSVVGAFGLHGRLGPGALEIGYWVHSEHTGRGIATAAAAALTEAALAMDGIGRVEIHCDEANLRSAAVPRKLGYRLDRIEASEITAPAESGRKMIWIRE